LPNEPSWLPADLITSFNELIVADTGEPHVLRDEGALENALAKPGKWPGNWNTSCRDAHGRRSDARKAKRVDSH
jgi:hypothetical protein